VIVGRPLLDRGLLDRCLRFHFRPISCLGCMAAPDLRGRASSGHSIGLFAENVNILGVPAQDPLMARQFRTKAKPVLSRWAERHDLGFQPPGVVDFVFDSPRRFFSGPMRSGGAGFFRATLQGGQAPLRLLPAETAGVPASGYHQVGELFVDSHGNLFFCKVTGSPGTWVKIA
jgi:hypothetical protein